MPEKSAARRNTLAVRIAALLLKERVAQLPLRDLAARLDTSDRMLLYYFENQDALVRASLAQLSHQLTEKLEQALPPVRLAPAPLLRKLLILTSDPAVAPVLRVWADVSARGARGEQPFADFAGASAKAWLDWIAARLDVAPRARRQKTAAALLLVIEGARMLELASPGATLDAAPLLARAFD